MVSIEVLNNFLVHSISTQVAYACVIEYVYFVFLARIDQKPAADLLAGYGTVFKSCGVTPSATCGGGLTNVSYYFWS